MSGAASKPADESERTRSALAGRVPLSRHLPFREALRVWIQVAALSFGGPAGQIAVMHRILVEERRWVSESRFLHALNYCMLLPGPEAQQLAIYIGWLLHGTVGGIVAGTLFVVPGIISIFALSTIYVVYGHVPVVAGLFFGLAPAVMAVVIEAVMRVGKRALKNRAMFALAAAAFVAIFFFEVPFPVIVLGAGLVGFIGGRVRPDLFLIVTGHKASGDANEVESDVVISDEARAARPTLAHALRVLAICGTLWLAPLAYVLTTRGGESVYAKIWFFFSKAAVVTFGGAYAVLSYIAQQAVEKYGWLKPDEMLTGLGMAETTPGPLIMVVQFVGFLAGYRDPETVSPMLAATAAALLTTWVTFVPCFLWIFLGAPYIEHLRGNESLSAALSGITAAVVGVILNLAVWFAVHTVFDRVGETHVGAVRLLVPEWSSLDVGALLIGSGAAAMIFWFKRGMIETLLAAAAVGCAYYLITT
jgi:chromate transporter